MTTKCVCVCVFDTGGDTPRWKYVCPQHNWSLSCFNLLNSCSEAIQPSVDVYIYVCNIGLIPLSLDKNLSLGIFNEILLCSDVKVLHLRLNVTKLNQASFAVSVFVCVFDTDESMCVQCHLYISAIISIILISLIFEI